MATANDTTEAPIELGPVFPPAGKRIGPGAISTMMVECEDTQFLIEVTNEDPAIHGVDCFEVLKVIQAALHERNVRIEAAKSPPPPCPPNQLVRENEPA